MPEHYREVADRRIAHVDKTLAAIHERLSKEIAFWSDRWLKLKEDQEAGKDVRLNLENARRTVADLEGRLENRKKELQSMRHVVNGTPVVLGGALVVPGGLMQHLRGDEPADRGGADGGPAPFGLLLSGLGACTAITLRMYAEHQSWPLAGVNVELTYVVKDRNTRWIDRLITLQGVDEDQRAKLAEIAEKTPVTRVVRAGTEIRTTTGAA